MIETFFKTIKSELIWPVAWQSRQQADNADARYIDGFHNPVRRHSSLGFESSIAFQRKARVVSQMLSTRIGQVPSAKVLDKRPGQLPGQGQLVYYTPCHSTGRYQRNRKNYSADSQGGKA